MIHLHHHSKMIDLRLIAIYFTLQRINALLYVHYYCLFSIAMKTAFEE